MMMVIMEAGRNRTMRFGNRIKGLAAAFGAVLLLGVSATSEQLLERRLPDMELNAIRFGVSLLTCCVWMAFCREWPLVQRSLISVTVLFTVATFLSIYCFFIAVSLLPLAMVSSVQSAATIISAILCFALFCKETITYFKVSLAALCLIGVLLIVQPLAEEQEGIIDLIIDLENETMAGINLVGSLECNVTVNETLCDEDASPKLGSFEDELTPTSLVGHIVGHACAVLSGAGLTLNALVIKRNPNIKTKSHQSAFLEQLCYCATVLDIDGHHGKPFVA